MGASVLGNVNCSQLDISGHARGQIEAANVIVHKNAVIEGDLNYSSLTIESGGVVTGKLKQSTPKLEGVSKNFDSKGVQTKTRIAFPVDLSEKLRNHESRMGAHLSLIDGSPVPAWINLTQDKLGLIVSGLELQQLQETGLKLEMRLHVGANYFDFNLPT